MILILDAKHEMAIKIQDGRHILNFIRNCCNSSIDNQKITKIYIRMHNYSALQINIKSRNKIFGMEGKIQDCRHKTINSFKYHAKIRDFE